MVTTELGMVIEVRCSQEQKAFSPMYVTELGTVKEVRPSQFLNAELSIHATEVGMVIEIRPLSAKAPFPMDVMKLGMVTEVMPLHPTKAYSLMVSILVKYFRSSSVLMSLLPWNTLPNSVTKDASYFDSLPSPSKSKLAIAVVPKVVSEKVIGVLSGLAT